ncbi:ANTAR domain-containing response regulator [Metaclostridioides mangenotii]|uniref:Stage 0 sporulation protein A homolog n=1 Tax=Metaclostridioides mangenotii TaxID=1540 RepID=A0ABS4E7L4_9FIRM|nr:response regulator [Clostridioides mangenotii]MBP1853931.1 response regulator NasT [Clostridioides mangenotii]
MKRKILLVDDDPLIRADIKDMLLDRGYNIIGEASDGFEAVEECKKHSPDLVILDIDMPILDGIKAGKIINKENLAGGILLLTSFDGEEYIEKAKSIGAFGYIVKPPNEKIIIPTIEMCLSKVEEFEKMKKNLDDINSKLTERKIIEKAKGILIKEYSITEEDAYSRIRKLSMDKRTTMVEISKTIIIGYDA